MASKSSVQFLGAAGTVTGSKHLIRHGGRQVMLDCGMFQGHKALRDRNWAPLPFAPKKLNAIVLSHAHIDHTGHLPLAVRHGFDGPVFCTTGTADLLGNLLRDAAYLQEEHAERANRRGFSRHKPALPLYTMEDAEAALKLLLPIPYRKSFEAAPDYEIRFRHTGHILGSASVEVKLHGRRVTRVLFSGDLGRWDRPILRDPVLPKKADVLILESTYGNRDHPPDPEEELARIIRHAADRGGPVIIPAFAVGRTQEIVWRIRLLENEGRIPVLPVYIDSPMAIDVTQIYQDHPEDHDLNMKQLKDDGKNPLRSNQFTIARSVEASKRIGELNGPFIVISASGMATGGRILHHLKRWLPEERATVLLCGFQAYGTRGRKLLEGAEDVRIFGKAITVNAKVEKINGLSAHADRTELQRWISELQTPPKSTYLVHGEPEASEAFAHILTQKKWKAAVAEEGAKMKLP